MRRRVVVSLVAFVVALVTVPARPAGAAPPTSDPPTAAKIAATWLAGQVTAAGFLPQAADPTKPNLSSSAEAVLALAAAGVGRAQADALVGYLGAHLDDYVVVAGHDDAGALATLVLDAVATGASPTDFGTGHVDLVTRLEATQQPNGLFGSSDPSFDGAFRQGLALLALSSVDRTNTAGTDWLVAQQCANGLWTAFRADTSAGCPSVDPTTFTGPDTNSTALAVLGLRAQGVSAPAVSGVRALEGVRAAGGGWGFLAAADQSTDANSTAIVLDALRAVNGTIDATGVGALLALQIGCDAAPADVGGVAFQDSPDGLVPDVLATVQAIPALAGAVLPLGASDIEASLPAACAPPSPETVATSTTVPVTTPPPASTGNRALARSGSDLSLETGVALVLIGVGGVLVCRAAERRRRAC